MPRAPSPANGPGTKDGAVPSTPSSCRSPRRPAGVDADYLLALQPYVLRSELYHRQLSRRKPMPEPKPPAPPPSASEAWSQEEVCAFVHATLLGAYGEGAGPAEEVVAAVRAELLDGARLRHLRLEDWARLCPCIGARIHLMEALKKVGPATPAPSPPNPPVPAQAPAPVISEAEPAGPAGRLDHLLGVTPAGRSLSPTPADSGGHPPTAGATAQDPNGGDVAVRVPKPPPRRPATLSYKTLLSKKSRFSNHRLVDTPWSPDPSRPWLVQAWQVFVFELLRVTFIAWVIRKFGLRLRQVPYMAIPLLATFLCSRLRLFVNFTPVLFTLIVVFPLAFSLNAAYQRREQALQFLASVKASAVAIHLFGETWTKSQLELPPCFLSDSAAIIRTHSLSLGHYLTAVSEEDKEVIASNILLQYSDLFFLVDQFRLSGIPPPLVAAPFNNIINMILGFESLRIFADYRTPCSLRVFCKSTLAAMTLCFAPLFAYVSAQYEPACGYLLCFAFFWLLLCMDNIQAMLENPFLTFGRSNAEDDINLSSLKGVVRTKKRRRPEGDSPVAGLPHPT